MKALFAALFFAPFSLLLAQYDFPVIINGIAVSLDYQSSKAIAATDWLALEESDCFPDSVLVSYTFFPRDNTPPSSASDSIYFDCTNFASESIEIWWKGSQGEWLVTDSYALIDGFDNCDCEEECPLATTPIAVNGLSTAYDIDGNVTVSARDLIAKSRAAHTYSFSEDPADSIRLYNCEDGAVQVLDVFAHAPGLAFRSTQTYIAINTTNCDSAAFSGNPPKVIQGLSIPTDQGGLITIPASVFATPLADHQQLSFSENAEDTLFSFNCAMIGNGSINVSLYDHSSGEASPPADSYIVGDDGRLFCSGFAPPIAFNDDFEQAAQLLSCEQFGQFQFASREDEEPNPDPVGNGNTVWYTFPSPDDNGGTTLSIRSVDSLYYAVYAPLELSASPVASGLISQDTTLILCWEGAPFDNWLLQIQQTSPDKVTRYYLSTGFNDACTSNASAIDREAISVYPNPSNGRFFIKGITPLLATTQIEAFNLNGQLIASTTRANSIDLSGQPSGTYFIRINTGTTLQVVRVIVE